jgi:hypothetical protein
LISFGDKKWVSITDLSGVLDTSKVKTVRWAGHFWRLVTHHARNEESLSCHALGVGLARRSISELDILEGPRLASERQPRQAPSGRRSASVLAFRRVACIRNESLQAKAGQDVSRLRFVKAKHVGRFTNRAADNVVGDLPLASTEFKNQPALPNAKGAESGMSEKVIWYRGRLGWPSSWRSAWRRIRGHCVRIFDVHYSRKTRPPQEADN